MKMVRAVVQNGKHIVRTAKGKQRAVAGDIVEVPESALAAFPKRLKREDVAQAEATASDTAKLALAQAEVKAKAKSEASTGAPDTDPKVSDKESAAPPKPKTKPAA